MSPDEHNGVLFIIMLLVIVVGLLSMAWPQ
jgi:hypothetical protein